MGKCVVIGLQSTGEARTMEALEREEELTDFVSTAKGVLQSLVEKHFPAPDRDKIHRILGIGKPKTIVFELGIKYEKNGGSAGSTRSSTSSTRQAASSSVLDTLNGGKRKRKAAENVKKRMKTDWEALGSSSEDDQKNNAESDYELNDHEDVDNDSDEEVHSDDFDPNGESDDDDDFNPFGSGSDEDDDPWARRTSSSESLSTSS
jgi:hypothetical protein